MEIVKTYGRKQLKRFIDKVNKTRTESRDAIIWDVIEEDRVCQVKIQGSTEYIYAHYPRNTTTKPNYCKIGNAVRIIHKGGNRGYVEIVGHGRAVPTGVGTPTLSTPQDAILSGLAIRGTSPETMSITVDSGTYRINGTKYISSGTTSGYYVMDDNPIVMDDTPIQMNSLLGAVIITTAPAAGYWRYDAIVIGTDGEFHAIAGVAATSNPVYPSTPADHLLLNYILVTGEVTYITQSDIGAKWSTRKAAYLHTVINPSCDDGGLVWTDPPPETQQTATITTTVYDQYHTAISAATYSPTGLWTLTFTIVSGDGTLFKLGTGSGTTITVSTSGTNVVIKYRRPSDGGDHSPIISVSIEEYSQIATEHSLLCLYDENGNLLI